MPCPAAMCARQIDCTDLRCPGHPLLHQGNGGHVFNNGVVFPLDGPQDEPTDGRPVPSVDQIETWVIRGFAVALLLIFLAAAASRL